MWRSRRRLENISSCRAVGVTKTVYSSEPEGQIDTLVSSDTELTLRGKIVVQDRGLSTENEASRDGVELSQRVS